MSGRTLLLILFLWAVLTVVTPILVRLSASARANGEFFVITHTSELNERMKAGKVMGLLARRALVAAAPRKKDNSITDTRNCAISTITDNTPPALKSQL